MDKHTKVFEEEILQQQSKKGLKIEPSFEKEKNTKPEPKIKSKVKKNEFTDGQLVVCYKDAENNIKKRKEYGLGSLTPEDYFPLK